MRCASCEHENLPDGRFCTKCGAQLGMRCGACGTPGAPEASFCGNCGALLQQAAPTGGTAMAHGEGARLTDVDVASASSGERRHLTVLSKFCEKSAGPLKRLCAGCGSELRPAADQIDPAPPARARLPH